MKHLALGPKLHKRLILIFLGWGMDATPFLRLRRNGYDIVLLWDYRELGIDWKFTEGYEEICIVAWSMGVFAAAHTTQSLENRTTLRLAINGTLHPVDDHLGIPEDIFFGTLQGLDERNLRKFYRRMFSEREKFAEFEAHRPQRGIPELKAELESIASAVCFGSEPVSRCDVALISEDDKIFPAANVWRAWQPPFTGNIRDRFREVENRATYPRVRALRGGHFVDLQQVLDDYVIDKAAAAARFARSGESYRENDLAQADVRRRLIDMLKKSEGGWPLMGRRCNILEIGAGANSFRDFFESECFPLSHKSYWDINMDSGESALEERRCCDAEVEIGRQQKKLFDLVLSSSTIQWFNSPEKFLSRLSQRVSKEGVVMLSTFVKDNLPEIAVASGRGLRLPTLDEWVDICQRHFDVTAAYEYKFELSFPTPLEAIRHLSATGVNGLGRTLAPGAFREVLARYPRRLDGRYYLTFRPALIALRQKDKK